MQSEKLNKILKTINENNDEIDKTNLYGILTSMILSKDYVKTNAELPIFLKEFDLEFKEYVYANRTTTFSQVIRKIEKMDSKEIVKMTDNVLNVLQKNNESSLPEKKDKKTKKNYFDRLNDQFN